MGRIGGVNSLRSTGALYYFACFGVLGMLILVKVHSTGLGFKVGRSVYFIGLRLMLIYYGVKKCRCNLKRSTPLLHSLLHSMQMLPLQCILSQAPGHDTAQLLGIHDVLELALDERGRVPGPEQVHLLVEVVLASGILVSHAVLLGTTPGVDQRDTLAGAVVGLTAGLAVGVCCAAVDLVSIPP